jgi:hypothetical protein
MRANKNQGKALLQQAALINLDNPTEKTRQAIMNEVTYGHGKRRGKRKGIPLYLPRGSALLYKDKEDLVSLKTPVFQDYVTSFVDKRMGKMFKVCLSFPSIQTESKLLNR